MNNSVNNVSLRLNQEHDLLSYCSDSGCWVYNIEPLHVKLSLDVKDFGTISICEMLHRSNLLALVAGGSRPKFADNTVVIWDDNLKKFVIELTFSSSVLSVKMRMDKIIVAEINQIHCFTMEKSIRKLFTVNTRNNPQGIFEVSNYANSERQLLCFPGHRVGSVQIIDLANCEPGASSSPVYVNAHENEIACLILNQQSTLLATASQKGTLIRVFDTSSPFRIYKIVELRRGSDVATFYCLNFSHNSEFLCASSDKGTIHIFALKDVHLNKRSTFKKMSFLGNYVESQWALTTFIVAAERPCVCAFGPNNTVYGKSERKVAIQLIYSDLDTNITSTWTHRRLAACVDGTITRYSYTPDGQNNRLSFAVFSEMTTVEEEE